MQSKQTHNSIRSKHRSSDILTELYGDTSRYVKIMNKEASKLKKKYPDKILGKFFSMLPNRIISISTMVLCDSLSQDLGKRCSDSTLAAIGLNSLPISTHDDVVDETPASREFIAGLVYAGNISALEGQNILFRTKQPHVAIALNEAVNENHYLQQLTVYKLWKGQGTISSEQYFDGIKHVCIFASIGPRCALAIANRENLKAKIMRFSTGYGRAVQLLDDIIEVEEDRKSGYSSLPLSEGKPFKQSFKEIRKNIRLARSTIDPRWRRMSILLKRLEVFAQRVERQISG